METTTNIKVPKKYQPMIKAVDHDIDGWWAYTTKGYYFTGTDCHTMSTDTQNELLQEIRKIKPCDCKECEIQ